MRKIPYYSLGLVLLRWNPHDEDEGCWPVHDVALSMHQSPPELAEDIPPPSPRAPYKRPDPMDQVIAVVNSFRRFRKWLDTPDPPKLPKVTPPPQVPSFDIQEIPGAMRRNLMFKSAELMERWFAGKLNYSPTSKEEVAEIDQDGAPYSDAMYDMSRIKMKWVLGYGRAKAVYDQLIKADIRSSAGMNQLKIVLRRHRNGGGDLHAWERSGKDLRNLHRHFQFQYAGVDSSMSQKLALFLRTRSHAVNGPDDLTGALGSFNFYAAIAYAIFEEGGSKAIVRSIYVYIKDNYTFTDDIDGPSQYLGHWSSKGVILVPYYTAVGLTHRATAEFPVAVGDPLVQGNIYYPIHNNSFRQWAEKHQRGGDFVVFSDRVLVALQPPLEVWL